MLINRDRAWHKMAEHGLDALVASTLENVVYLTDFDPDGLYNSKMLDAFAVLSLRGTPALIAPAIALTLMADVPAWPVTIFGYGSFPLNGPFDRKTELEERIVALASAVTPAASPIDALIYAIKQQGLDAARLGVDEQRITWPAWHKLESALPKATVVAASNVFRQIRMVKSAKEIERLRHSCQITEASLAETLGIAKPGVVEEELVNAFMTGVTKRGAFPGSPSVSLGTRTAAVLPPSKTLAFQHGDLLKFDVGCIWRCYWSDIGRTAVAGKPSDKQEACYRAVAAAEQEAIGSIRAGVAVAEVYEKAIAAARKSGIPHFARHHVGHSIGLELYDSFRLQPSEGVVLEENMVFSVETPYYEVGFGGLQLEDTVCVTKTGCSYLSSLPRDLYVI